MTVIFFAGAEVDILTKALLDNGVKRILYSYYYILTMQRETFIDKMQSEYKDVEWFLDSGAFTYGQKWNTDPGKLMDYRQYKKLYFRYINATWNRWVRIAELDLDKPEGWREKITMDMLEEWRTEMHERWPDANIMVVWQLHRGPEEWTSYVRDRRFKYLAIGSGPPKIGNLRKMVMEAHTWRKPVHGFGMTHVNTVLPYVPYDSVDSTSWVLGQKYGTLYVFKNNKFKTLAKKDLRYDPKDAWGHKTEVVRPGYTHRLQAMGKADRQLYMNYFKNIGCNPKLIMSDARLGGSGREETKERADAIAEVRKANIIAWRNLANRLEYMRKREGRSLYGVSDPGVGLNTVEWPNVEAKEREHGPADQGKVGSGRPRARERSRGSGETD